MEVLKLTRKNIIKQKSMKVKISPVSGLVPIAIFINP
jgi:hypothetical protein